MQYRFCLIARDIQNSVTPKTYETFCRDLGHTCSFQIFNIEPQALAETAALVRERMDGFNVTMPYKRAFLAHCDELDESAASCGSTNAVLVRDGRLIGYNTDGWGLVKALSLKGLSLADKDVVLVGAGGVALSIAYYASLAGVRRIDVLNLFPEETDILCGKFPGLCHPHPLSGEALERCCGGGADFFFNASVLGQVAYADYEDLSFLDHLKKSAVVYDVNYSNPDAKLPPAARARGLAAFTGRSMSACQGILSMEIWTGQAPSDACARALTEALEQA